MKHLTFPNNLCRENSVQHFSCSYSDVEWLCDVPKHWEILKLRRILTSVAARNQPDLPLLSVVREKGVILRDIGSKDENRNFIPDDLTNYKVVHKGQFAMNKMKAWQGSYGVSRHEGIVSPAYFTFDIGGVTGDYFHKAIRSKAYVPFFAQASDGVRIGQWDLSRTRMKEIPFVVPPLAEQKAIVRYLDHVDGRIQRYIEAKEKLILLLQEARQATIHRAVTRGLDPDVPLKPSGVEWLGDVPAHWEIVPNRYLMSLKKDIVGDQSGNYTLLSLTKQGIIKRDMEKAEGKFPASFDTYQVVKPGDLIFCLFDIDETPRTVGLSEFHGMITSAYSRFVCEDETTRKFLYFLYLALDNGKLLKPLYSGLRKVISKTTFLRTKVALPPKKEQIDILSFLDKTSADIDATIDKARRQCEFMREYRTSLIAHVVTGKLDVRAAAAQLPQEATKQESTVR